jgi:hypothetical protein
VRLNDISKQRSEGLTKSYYEAVGKRQTFGTSTAAGIAVMELANWGFDLFTKELEATANYSKVRDEDGKVLAEVGGVVLHKIGEGKQITVPSQTEFYRDCPIRTTYGIQCRHEIAAFGEVFCKEAFASRWRREREFRVSRHHSSHWRR